VGGKALRNGPLLAVCDDSGRDSVLIDGAASQLGPGFSVVYGRDFPYLVVDSAATVLSLATQHPPLLAG